MQYLALHQLYLAIIKHMLKCEPQVCHKRGKTVDICAKVLWESVTKTVHPKHN